MSYISPVKLPYIPDNLSIPQFILDSQHASRPMRPDNVPWLIEDITGRRIGFEELRARSYGLANALSTRWNIGENDVVCLFSPNTVDYPVSIWAVHKLGGIITPSNPAYTVPELIHQIRTTKAKLIIVHADFVKTALAAAKDTGVPVGNIVVLTSKSTKSKFSGHATVEQLISEGINANPNFTERQLAAGEAKTKLAFLSLSSGTTGTPKAVAIPHYALIANIIQMTAHQGNKRYMPGDVVTGVLPFFHIYGLVVNMHFMLFKGMSLVVIERFSFVEFLKSIVRLRITHILIVPPQVVLFCKHPEVKNYDLSHIKFCMCGAAPLSPELTQQFIQVLPNCDIGQGYGLTETCTTVCMQPPDQRLGTFGSAGQLIAGIQAKVVKPDGQLAAKGEPGELVVKGPSMALYYLNNDKATKETFVDGWVHTGDEVVINDKLEVFVVDRLKEIMKVRGFQVAPAELEGHLLDHPDVSDVCVVGISDDFSGEVPLAFVVLNEKAAKRITAHSKGGDELKAALMKHVADHKVAYKHLSDLEFVDSVPKNPSGKLLRRVLRDKATAARKSKQAKL